MRVRIKHSISTRLLTIVDNQHPFECGYSPIER
jgi:hypothetical protein